MRSKKIFAVFLITIILVSITAGVIYFKNNEKELFQISLKSMTRLDYKKNIEISLGDKIPSPRDYSEQFTQDIIWSDKDIEEKVKKVGIYYGIVSFRNNPIFITLSVVDKNPPVIQNVKDITITVGDSVELEKQVQVIDDSNEEVNLVVNGDYSISKAGTYQLTYEATDKSGNVSTADFKLIVKENSSTIPTQTTKGYSITKINGVYYIKGILIANKTYDLPSSYAPGGLTKETNEAFLKMQEDASKEGISLKIISGYRSYSSQQSIYNRYVNRDGQKIADRYSARPGHSEHQTGLAFDVNSLEQSFGNTKAGIWLSENCYKYGFILRYPEGKESITGYMYEPWHFRYIGDEAINLYNNGNWITLEEYLGIDSKYSS